ncbi:iron-siderophore ABC transporter substrate-binding protein [Actinomadura alba]|uniref:Iron-siderophore ABC transporter substrate-binding protein n=1 Tax=Actinomadura alba TaxID=406431 RepID=A0ABR7LSK7_9ACTN|nr:iron-siderophore ABC transporter substrate-binding protein [Actinomadura alba]MBC6467828.1 iron-siderophore ABC transporter substrate-binding protein [Actinomadura alba]
MKRPRTSGPFLRRARLAGLFTSLALALTALTACGGGSESETSAPAASGGTAFPVTVQHKYGSTTITKEPKRIVTVGLTDQDALLALGVVPVGATEFDGGYPGAIGPWAQDRRGGAALPEVLKDTGGGPPLEKVAALKPDLILSLYAGTTKNTYTTLSKIAPTVAQPKEYADYGIPWQELTKTAGLAIGKREQAEKVVADLEARLAKERKDQPEFKGRTGLLATPYDGHFVYGAQDPRSRVLASLGFTIPADLDKVIGAKFGANISRERVDLLDTDAIVWIVPDVKADRSKLHADRLYGALEVAEQEREVFLDEKSSYGHAVSFASVLSIPYVLDRLVPQLAKAVDGDAATKVVPAT